MERSPQPKIEHIIGKAVCRGCGSETFEVILYDDSTYAIACIKADCRAYWPPEAGGQAQDTGGYEAMGKTGDESPQLVSTEKAREEYRDIIGEMRKRNMVGYE